MIIKSLNFIHFDGSLRIKVKVHIHILIPFIARVPDSLYKRISDAVPRNNLVNQIPSN